MSETPNIPTENEHVHIDETDLSTDPAHTPLDQQNVKQALVRKRIRGMSTSKKVTWLLVILLLIGEQVMATTNGRAVKLPLLILPRR